MDGMDIGATIQQQRNDFTCRTRGCAMKWCTSGAIATIHKRWIRIQQPAGLGRDGDEI